ncbi:hypothetical protein LB533_20500 [Mesorhizobium sp. BR1-1-13]|uniref:hypothetical protein n=1 Tax=Mesorhizobium sp. BR1-1-13 TaxID=2876656 RepID=UPI001CD0A4C3|nr:hypothetical protein [Mesorhizobium sp. BR1-1-13]MBZ9943470.1 hypothetical protein [Mesorhizobium sp. BR1-1-13]
MECNRNTAKESYYEDIELSREKNRENQRIIRKKDPDAYRKMRRDNYAKNAEKVLERERKRRIGNLAAINTDRREKRATNRDSINAAMRKRYADNIDIERNRSRARRTDKSDEVKQYYRDRYAENPALRLHAAISTGIRSGLKKGQKAGRKTFDLLGYSVEDLKRHLEERFLPGMSWDNYGKGDCTWEIDHIIPQSAFHFKTPEDIDFRKCWALANLTPLWGVDNRSKSDKLTKPFQPSLAIALPDNDNRIKQDIAA